MQPLLVVLDRRLALSVTLFVVGRVVTLTPERLVLDSGGAAVARARRAPSQRHSRGMMESVQGAFAATPPSGWVRLRERPRVGRLAIRNLRNRRYRLRRVVLMATNVPLSDLRRHRLTTATFRTIQNRLKMNRWKLLTAAVDLLPIEECNALAQAARSALGVWRQAKLRVDRQPGFLAVVWVPKMRL